MMDLQESLASRDRAGIILDTNILLLYFVGAWDKPRISTFKRTQTFAPEDFDTLVGFLQYFRKVATLPNILAEVSNLLGELTGKLRQTCFQHFAYGIDLLDEQYVPSKTVSKSSEFGRFGLTDAAILQLAQANYLVLTDDFELAGYLTSRRLHAFNFNHIRTYYWHM